MNLHVSHSVVTKLVWSKYADNSKRQFRLYQLTGRPKRIEQNLFVSIGKSEAEVTNNKSALVLMRPTVEADCR